MYLPTHCTFRMTDIWRSFVAQRCLWELGYGVVFHPPEVIQERNLHNLMRDFQDEIPGYQHNEEIVRCLNEVKLKSGVESVHDNLLACYGRLVSRGFFPDAEMSLLRAWLADLQKGRCI